jgi:hypothetical protein
MSCCPPLEQEWIKDPDAKLDYSFDLKRWLNRGDAIDSVAFSYTGSDSALVIVGSGNTTTVASAIISGGTSGVTYTLQARVTTTEGLVDDFTKEITIL